ncbi:MAG: serine/threonine-protein kinase [Planctomycetota bacterium]|jgi:serine/threonine protein kinase|nr:serine/threonine-protein kinase [Planctomycetota bacterium]
MARSVLGRRFKRGETIGDRYQVVKVLGEGGAGCVYRCKDLKKEGDDVAVKLLEDAGEAARFRREARVMNRTRSPHVVKLLDRGFHDKQFPYLAMEFMDGGSVRDLLDRRGKLPIEEACWLLVQTIGGLKATSSVHRDLKPENLLLSKGNKGRGYTLVPGDVEDGVTVKVSDFGLAKSRDAESVSLTHSGQVMGTPVYMSPEQCRNTKRVSVKTDIYALGVILYEMVCGKPPFDANNIYDIMAMHCNDEPKLGRVPSEVRGICERCLRKEPGKRFTSLAALERDLKVVAGLRKAGAKDDDDGEGGGFGIWVVIAIVVLAGLLYAGWYYRERASWLDAIFP